MQIKKAESRNTLENILQILHTQIMIRQSYDCLRFSGTGTLDGSDAYLKQVSVKFVSWIYVTFFLAHPFDKHHAFFKSITDKVCSRIALDLNHYKRLRECLFATFAAT